MRFITDGQLFELTPEFCCPAGGPPPTYGRSRWETLTAWRGSRCASLQERIILRQTEAGGRYRATHGQRGLADSTRPELDADSWADGPGCLRHRMLPSPLAGTAHHQKVTMTDLVLDGDAAAAWPEQEVAGGAE
jgi:hypothetical protein